MKNFDVNPNQSGYWKVGFTCKMLNELNSIAKKTGESDKKCGSQFEKIGYVGHLCAPLGYTIELRKLLSFKKH